MKISFNLLFIVLLLSVTNVSNAQKSKPQPAASKGMSIAEANKIITYTNSVAMFLSECYATSHIEENQMLYHRNILQDTREKKTSQDAFENKNKYATQEDCIATIKSRGAIDPKNPPAEIGQANQSFFKEKFSNIEKLLTEIGAQNTALRKYFDNNLQLKNKKEKDAAHQELNKYDALVEKIYKEQDEVYAKVYELGDKAEMVTLAKHPLLKEIMDMKKILRYAGKVTNLAQGDATIVEKNLPQIQSIISDMKLNSAAYANYEVFRKGQSPRMDEARQYVKEYYGKAEDFYKDVAELQKNYKGNALYERPKWQAYIAERYKYFVEAYNNFVSSNNR